jgi:ADP-heptose:LPS heptosyltransferase
MRILVRLPNWLGDAVMSSAFLRGLAVCYQGACIEVIIRKELNGLTGFLPCVNEVHYFSKQEYPGLSGAWRFGKQFRRKKFDLFFSLPDSFSSAIMGLATGASQRIGYRKELRSLALTRSYTKKSGIHRVLEFTSLLALFTGKKLMPEVRLETPAPFPETGAVLINFNSEASSRRIPLRKARILLQKLIIAFPGTPFTCIGSPREKAFIDQILYAFPENRIHNLAGATSLEELANRMRSAKVLLTTDSGPAHLANGLGLPVIVLFGAGNEYNTAPFNKKDLHVIRAGKLPCEPCVKNTCRLYDEPECMNQLDDELIIQHLKLYLPDVEG